MVRKVRKKSHRRPFSTGNHDLSVPSWPHMWFPVENVEFFSQHNSAHTENTLTVNDQKRRSVEENKL